VLKKQLTILTNLTIYNQQAYYTYTCSVHTQQQDILRHVLHMQYMLSLPINYIQFAKILVQILQQGRDNTQNLIV